MSGALLKKTLAVCLGAALLAPAAAGTDFQKDLLTEVLWQKIGSLPREKRPKVALVLSGGGARGLSHIGVLKVIEREHIPVDLIVGTSVGAVAGALYAAGLPVSEIEKMGAEVGWDKLTDLSAAGVVSLLVQNHLLSTEKMEKYLKNHIGEKSFADLKIPLACLATDIRTGEQIVLREGSVALAARASATMPGIFDPVPYRHRLLVDGGIIDNVPTDVAKLMGAEVIICVYVPPDFSRYNVTNVLTTLVQTLYIQGQVIGQDRIKQADFVVVPKVEDVAAHELWRSRECMEAGQAAAENALTALKKLLIKKFLEKSLAS